ncbi:galactose mutarotase-like domain-containing protein [Jimgerdemannia flammicorona]|uniref:Galactose mutarotase-like domain-containing protein n=1 Tax=Jimgerdemannia flammicorona TaxID=994334 RepID=A0A433D4T0_9FUNG|nr:galactose mutarotase-like domain-containing protein [Jimgerdemannia flammicorona]
MRQQNPRNFSYDKSVRHPVTFTDPKGNRIQLKVISDTVVRVLHTAPNQFDYTLADDNTPPVFDAHVEDGEKRLVLETGALRAVINFNKGLDIAWYPRAHPGSPPLLEDLPNRAYPADPATGAVWHYLKQRPDDAYYGLGERTGDLNIKGRRFRLERLDCMGYDAEKTDPLYKFSPFYITLSKDTGLAHGIYYNNISKTTVDLGNEIDALWGPYRYYHAEAGPLDYYIIFGPSVQNVIEGFSSLVGKPEHLPPRYSFGYLASAMGYAEAENAQELLENFPERCRRHEIPCDGLHLSSGYTVTEDRKVRCVFTWNTKRFPDAKLLMANLKDAGIHVFANIKPWLLETHPYYGELKKLKGYIWNDEDDVPGEVMQWSAGAGESANCAYVDFTSQEGFDWWKRNVKNQLLDYGLAGMWNDNNEFTMLDDSFSFANQVKPAADLHRPLPSRRMESGLIRGHA